MLGRASRRRASARVRPWLGPAARRRGPRCSSATAPWPPERGGPRWREPGRYHELIEFDFAAFYSFFWSVLPEKRDPLFFDQREVNTRGRSVVNYVNPWAPKAKMM